MFALILLTLVLVALWARGRFASFMAQKVTDYGDEGPEVDIRQHLNGALLCEGVIYGPTGRVASRFVADMHASWQGNTGQMSEHFRYASGATQDRIWTLTLDEGGKIRAEAPDLVGTGHGAQAGPAVQLNYKIRLPEDAGGHVLAVTDWMYLMENGTLINRSQFRKFGLKVGELVATMRPHPDRMT